jgi:hypothetical protein
MKHRMSVRRWAIGTPYKLIWGVVVDGSVIGAPSELKNGMEDGNQVVANNVIEKADDVEYGSVIGDASGNKFFLRDDIASRDVTEMQNVSDRKMYHP